MKCSECSREGKHLANALHEEVVLRDGGVLELGVIPNVEGSRPMLCDCCWIGTVQKLHSRLVDQFKERYHGD